MPLYLYYYVWLVLVSLIVFGFERVYPWRKEQKVLREGIWQDLFWLVFNGHYFGLLLAILTGKMVVVMNAWLGQVGLPVPDSLHLLQAWPLWLQGLVFFILQDFISWNTHRLLHNVPVLWKFHKVHHSIEDMDWIGSMRFHWAEVVIYKTIAYLPLVILGVDSTVLLIIAVVNTLIGHFNHANIGWDWGPLRYIFNSPRMHIWHHDVELHGKGGQNFGISLSVWDWIFGTAYMPDGPNQEPDAIGFEDIQNFPRDLVSRLLYPISMLWFRPSRSASPTDNSETK